jgi:hypothetical protein
MAGETLSKDEVCRRLGVEGKALDEMIRRGRWPRGFKPTHKSRPVWSVAVFEAAVLVLPLLSVTDEPEAEEDS